MTLYPINTSTLIRVVIDVHVAAADYEPLFPEEFWDAAMILDPVRSSWHGVERPKRWGLLVAELVYAPLGIDVDLKSMVTKRSEKWHQHLDAAGRSLVLRQCKLISRAVRMGTTLPKLRRAFARRSTPKKPIGFSFMAPPSFRTTYASRIVP